MDELHAVLRSEYGIAGSVSPVVGGLSALAYRVDTAQGEYFLKVYDKKKSGTAAQLEKLSLCMEVASWLERGSALTGRINAPLPTVSGHIRAETQGHAYLLFAYIHGAVPGTTPLSVGQQEELAEIVGLLHGCRDLPFDLSGVRETFDIPCAELLNVRRDPHDSLCVHQQYDMLMRAIDRVQKLSERIKAARPQFVLCHTDIHGWNLMQSESMVLIDWESIKLAPAEADLYTFWGDWYWGDSQWGGYWDVFLPVYRRLRPEYAPCEEALRFYQLRRHIEDANDFFRQYLYDAMSTQETAEVVSCLERECYFIGKLMQP